MLGEDGGYGAEGTAVSGVRTWWLGLEERTARKGVTGHAEVSSGAMGTVASVAESHLGYSNRKGPRALWMVQYRRIYGYHHLRKAT